MTNNIWEDISASDMYEEIRDEWRNDTISEETRDYVMSTAYKTDKILDLTPSDDDLTVSDWAEEMRSEWADNTISKEARDHARKSFNEAWSQFLKKD